VKRFHPRDSSPRLLTLFPSFTAFGRSILLSLAFILSRMLSPFIPHPSAFILSQVATPTFFSVHDHDATNTALILYPFAFIL